MNIFAIESDESGNIDWKKSATSQDNYRVVKMILESVQMLCTTLNDQHGYQITPYKNAHLNHPSTKWKSVLRFMTPRCSPIANQQNFLLLCQKNTRVIML